jgi:hypothetical protein
VRKTTLYLDEETALRLRQVAAAQGRSQADVVREAVGEYTARQPRPLPKGIGQYESASGDVAPRAEELLRQAARERRWD